MVRSILVLCEGNICRSPMAEALLRDALPDCHVSSAGLNALIGSAADPIACRLMLEAGHDISGHRATQVTQEMVARADLVLTMDQEQRQRLAQLYPQVHGRTFLIGHHGRTEVADPYRRGEAAFRDALDLITTGVAEWLPRIQRLSQSGRKS